MHSKPSLCARIIESGTTPVSIQTTSMRGVRMMRRETMWVRVWVNQADPPSGSMSHNEAVSAQVTLSAKVRMEVDGVLVRCVVK